MEIRLGTIGSNFIVHNLLRHVVKNPGYRYTAAYSRSAEKAEALAAQYGAKRFYSDMDAFLADEEINFVYIAVPNILHYAQAKAALLAGKNVLLEKPFCPEEKLARELVEIAREKGLILVDMVPTAFLPNLPVLKEQLKKAGCEERLQFPFHQGIIDGTLPLTIGGGIGQSRVCMFMLEKAHVGEVQVSVWPEDMIRECEEHGITLLQ